MKVLVILDEPALPNWTGNRRVLAADVKSLQAAGHNVDLIVFRHKADTESRTPPTEGETLYVKRTNFLATTLRAPLEPYQSASRRLGHPTLATIASSFPTPDVIIAEHEWTMGAALSSRTISGWSKIPIILRSHNDEAEFMSAWASERTGASGLYAQLEARRTSRRWVLAKATNARSVWALSQRDADIYQDAGIPARVVPAAQDGGPTPVRPRFNPQAKFTVGFLGSLHVPQAVYGLRWFLSEVWPRVLRGAPSARLVIAGRNCPPHLRDQIERAGAVYLGSVESPTATIKDFDVFINPVFTGSGVNIKLLDPIRLGVPVVTTTFGMRGFEQIATIIPPADTIEAFTDRVLMLLTQTDTRPEMTEQLRKAADTFAVNSVAALMRTALEDAIA